jgi:hypothetical protein
MVRGGQTAQMLFLLACSNVGWHTPCHPAALSFASGSVAFRFFFLPFYYLPFSFSFYGAA